MGLVQEGIKVLLLGIIQFFLSTEGKKIHRLLKQQVKGTASNLAASACIIKSLKFMGIFTWSSCPRWSSHSLP